MNEENEKERRVEEVTVVDQEDQVLRVNSPVDNPMENVEKTCLGQVVTGIETSQV